jgi:galactosamine-6-phosphate isomerase
MQIITTADYAALSREAADFIADALRAEPDLTLALATGSSPTGCYELLAEYNTHEPDLFERARIIKLDEWGGLEMDDPATCEAYLQQYIVQPLGIDPARYTGFHSRPADPQAECVRLRMALDRLGPIGLCVLGLGANGHLGFNEPADELTPWPHVAQLSQETLRHPMAQQTESTIVYGLTLGMAHIMQARRILLLVNGAHKREQLTRVLQGAVSTHFPASLLCLHADMTVICDAAAHGVSDGGEKTG